MSAVVNVNGVSREAPGMYAAVDGVLRAIAEPAPELADLTADATATAANIEKGYTAYVNGVKVTGTAEIPKVQYEIVEFTKATSVACSLGRITKVVGAITGIYASSAVRVMATYGFIKDTNLQTVKPNDGHEYDITCTFDGSNFGISRILDGVVVFFNDPSAESLF